MSDRFVEILQREVSQGIRELAAYRLLDWLGCAVVGAREAQGRAVADYARSHPAGTVACIGGGKKEASVAAFVNGALGNILEMDDLHRLSIVHPGDTVVPAALAVAQRESATSEALLSAIARGYEAAIRVGEAAGPGHYRYWYSSATCGVFGAAVAAASLMSLDDARLADAVGLAGMQSAGLWQCRIEAGFAKQLATARAAQGGVLAADLARGGFPAPRQIIEGELGLLAATSPQARPEALGDCAMAWKIAEVSEKPWPGCRHTHPVIEAALRYRTQVEGDDIAQVEIYTYRSAVEFCDDVAPDSPHRARFSLQHAFALGFIQGEPQLKDYESAALSNARIASLRTKVAVFESPEISAEFPQRFGCRVMLYTRTGDCIEHRILSAKGDPESPADAATSRKKFNRLMAYAGVSDDLSWGLEQVVLGLPASEGTPLALFEMLDSLADL